MEQDEWCDLCLRILDEDEKGFAMWAENGVVHFAAPVELPDVPDLSCHVCRRCKATYVDIDDIRSGVANLPGYDKPARRPRAPDGQRLNPSYIVHRPVRKRRNQKKGPD